MLTLTVNKETITSIAKVCYDTFPYRKGKRSDLAYCCFDSVLFKEFNEY